MPECATLEFCPYAAFARGAEFCESFVCRIMQLDAEAAANADCCLNIEALLRQRLRAASELRRALDLPNEETTVFRLCNSEGDRLSGLIVDVLGNVAVVASSAAWVERCGAVFCDVLSACESSERSNLPVHIFWSRPLASSYKTLICEILVSMNGIERVVWRPNLAMLKEEGLLPDGEMQVTTGDAWLVFSVLPRFCCTACCFPLGAVVLINWTFACYRQARKALMRLKARAPPPRKTLWRWLRRGSSIVRV